MFTDYLQASPEQKLCRSSLRGKSWESGFAAVLTRCSFSPRRRVGRGEDGGAGEAPPEAMPQPPPQGLHQQGMGRLLEERDGKTPRRSVQRHI